MRELVINLWDYIEHIDAICIPSNCNVNKKGKAVMGAGFAKQVKQRYKDLPTILGNHIENNKKFGELVSYQKDISDSTFTFLNFPTKINYWHKSSISLIEESCSSLYSYMETKSKDFIVALPAPGVGKGGLDYSTEVKPVLLNLFDSNDRLIVTFMKPF